MYSKILEILKVTKEECPRNLYNIASSNRPSGESRGKEVTTARGIDPSSWISDDETRERFLDGRVEIIVPPKYLNLSMFERKGFQFPGWLETRELSTFVKMKGDWYPNLVTVFYNNLRITNGVLQSRVKGVNIYINNDVWQQIAGLKAEGIFSHIPNSETNRWLKKRDIYINWLRFPGRYTIERIYVDKGLNMEERITAYLLAWVILPGRLLQDKMTTKDVYLLYAIKNYVPTNWMEVLKDHMTNVALRQSHYLPYVVFVSRILVLQGVDSSGEQKCSCNCTNMINRNTIASLGLVKIIKGWCFKGEEDSVNSSGSTPIVNEERTNFFPETNFERFAVDQFRILIEKVNQLERKFDDAQPKRESSSSHEDSMKTSESEYNY
ncbi:hypothetical protein LR48_Vigan10g168500 [Vigna angularis]|uniref:Uncharacterized protein n=1 Tax=Phaseolus angularis TaxID=3914 RepID=A0A0L9VLE4_PHAAN|nr:hypothetical protein LR48_Vigan10g168500 [Vigna angularis]